MATKPVSNATSGQPSVCPVLLYGIPDVARSLNLGMTSVWALVRDNKLEVVRIGRRTCIKASTLEAFVSSLTCAK